LSANLDADYREKLGITHVVSVCTDCSSTGPNHLVISVDDNEYEDILVHMPKAVEFTHRALEEGGKVLVHCVMGVSRSPTIVAAYREFCVTLPRVEAERDSAQS
jgi:dual specificity phosphatase 12